MILFLVKKMWEMIFFPNLLGQLGSMEFRGSYGKISKVGDLKSRLKWYMEETWGIIVNIKRI